MLLVVDLGGLEPVNDIYGDGVGNVLRQVAAIAAIGS
jgi:GGDEF domain-containing protein